MRVLTVVPILAITAIAIGKFMRVSFAVYLKHQALIDSYHDYKMKQKYEGNLKEKSPEEVSRI